MQYKIESITGKLNDYFNDKNEILLKSRIINNRIRILSRDSLAESEFVSRSFGEYFDVEPYLQLHYRKVIEGYNEVYKDGR